MAGKDEGASVVEVFEVVLEGGNHIGVGHAVHVRFLLFERKGEQIHRIELAVVGCEHVAGILVCGGLRGKVAGCPLAHALVVDGGNVGFV